jgi:hypothetical protein
MDRLARRSCIGLVIGAALGAVRVAKADPPPRDDAKIGRVLVGRWTGTCPDAKTWTFEPGGAVTLSSADGQVLSGTFHEDGTYSGEGHGGGFPNFSNAATVTLADHDHMRVKYTWQIPPFQGAAHSESCTAARVMETPLAGDIGLDRSLPGRWSGQCERGATVWAFGTNGSVAMSEQSGQTAKGTVRGDGALTATGGGGGFPNFSITGAVVPQDRDDVAVKFTWQVPPFQGPQHPSTCTAARIAPPDETPGDVGHRACSGVSLLDDCSFEAPGFAPATCQFHATGDKVGAWSVVGAPGNVGACGAGFVESGFSFPPEDGRQAMDLTGTSNSATGVSQTVSTARGAKYRLSFWVGNVVNPGGHFGTTSKVIVLVDGAPVLTVENADGVGSMSLTWRPYSVVFRASSATATIAFMNADAASDTSNFVDDVTLVPAQD